MSYKFKLNDVKLGDNSDFQMTIGNLEIETSAEVYKILVPFYEKSYLQCLIYLKQNKLRIQQTH